MVWQKEITGLLWRWPKTMLSDSKISDIFCSQAISIVTHIQNRGMLRANTRKNPYEHWKGKPTNVKYFKVFGSKCYIMRDDGKLGKFDSRSDEGMFLGYSC